MVRDTNDRKPPPPQIRHDRDPDLGDGLFELSFRLQALLTRVGAAHDLSLAQMRVLGILRDREPGLLELAGYLEVEKSSLSGLVTRAEARGLVERIPSRDDGRAVTIRITALGRRLARTVYDAAAAEASALVEVLPVTERERLRGLVARVVRAAASQAEGPPRDEGPPPRRA